MTLKQLESSIRKLTKQRDAARRQGLVANERVFDKDLRSLKREYKAQIKKTQMMLPGFDFGGLSDGTNRSA